MDTYLPKVMKKSHCLKITKKRLVFSLTKLRSDRGPKCLECGSVGVWECMSVGVHLRCGSVVGWGSVCWVWECMICGKMRLLDKNHLISEKPMEMVELLPF